MTHDQKTILEASTRAAISLKILKFIGNGAFIGWLTVYGLPWGAEYLRIIGGIVK